MHRRALLLERIFLKFHKPFGSRKHRHKLRNQLCQIACRPLYACHKLKKGRHAAERQRMAVHPYGSPQKSYKIANGKAEIEDKARKQREHRAPYHIVAQFALRCLQPFYHGLVLFKSFYEHTVLYRFLKNALHPAVAVAHVARKTAHAPHIKPADEHKQRKHYHDDHRQHGVHREQIEKRTKEKGHYRQRAGHGLGKKLNHILYVEFKTVEHVAAVHAFASVPFRTQYSVEHLLLHAVLSFYSENVPHPYRSYVDGKVAQHENSHNSHSPIERAAARMRCHVDGILHSPYRQQTCRHA